MATQDRTPKDQYPTSKDLAAAIKNLPHPGPHVPPQKVEIDAGPNGRYLVTFVVRQNEALSTPTWFWGIESRARIPSGQTGAVEEHPQDPD